MQTSPARQVLPRNAQQSRRWSDPRVEPPELMFAAFLSRRPSAEEALRFLVALLAWPIGAKGGMVVRWEVTGPVVAAEFMDQIHHWSDPLQREEMVSHTKRILDVTHRQYFQMAAMDSGCPVAPLAIWTLGPVTPHAPALILFLAQDARTDLIRQRADRVVDLLGVHLATTTSVVTSASRNVTPGRLSARQITITKHLADNLTMRQIASRIGFSESTVRSESLAIYRALGVHDRRGAIAVAVATGILSADGVTAQTLPLT